MKVSKICYDKTANLAIKTVRNYDTTHRTSRVSLTFHRRIKFCRNLPMPHQKLHLQRLLIGRFFRLLGPFSRLPTVWRRFQGVRRSYQTRLNVLKYFRTLLNLLRNFRRTLRTLLRNFRNIQRNFSRFLNILRHYFRTESHLLI